MTETLRQWILSLAATGLLTALALQVTPKGRVHKILQLVCGVAMIFALVSPVLELDFSAYSLNLARYREEAAQWETAAEESSSRLTRTIIEAECAAYILDKAQDLGLGLTSVTVTAKWGDVSAWCPDTVYIDTGGAGKSETLAGIIEAELGIPAERQYWS